MPFRAIRLHSFMFYIWSLAFPLADSSLSRLSSACFCLFAVDLLRYFSVPPPPFWFGSCWFGLFPATFSGPSCTSSGLILSLSRLPSWGNRLDSCCNGLGVPHATLHSFSFFAFLDADNSIVMRGRPHVLIYSYTVVLLPCSPLIFRWLCPATPELLPRVTSFIRFCPFRVLFSVTWPLRVSLVPGPVVIPVFPSPCHSGTFLRNPPALPAPYPRVASLHVLPGLFHRTCLWPPDYPLCLLFLSFRGFIFPVLSASACLRGSRLFFCDLLFYLFSTASFSRTLFTLAILWHFSHPNVLWSPAFYTVPFSALISSRPGLASLSYGLLVIFF